MSHDSWTLWPEELRRAAEHLLDLALDEDLGSGDVTARYFSSVGGEAAVLRAKLVAREEGVLAGMPLFLRVFEGVSERLGADAPRIMTDGADGGGDTRVLEARNDGSAFAAGETLATLEAPAAVVHGAERTALNFLQRLCGVASVTARAVAQSRGPAVLDTRKTTPGYRLLEKYAVRMGGGVNHRFGLYDAAMVKDNHKDACGGIPGVMVRAKDLPSDLTLIVEVDSLAELTQVLRHEQASRVKRVLLDNFSTEDVLRAVALRGAMNGGPDFEISGGLRFEDLSDPAYAGVEAASLGSLTHSVRALDLALEVEV